MWHDACLILGWAEGGRIMDLWYALAIRDTQHLNEETAALLEDAEALALASDEEDEEGQ